MCIRDRGIPQLLDKLKAPIPPLAERRPDVPADIVALVGDFLQKKPDDRPTSARECADWLETQLDEESSGERILSRAIVQTMGTPSLVPPVIEPTTEIGLAEVEELDRKR